MCLMPSTCTGYIAVTYVGWLIEYVKYLRDVVILVLCHEITFFIKQIGTAEYATMLKLVI